MILGDENENPMKLTSVLRNADTSTTHGLDFSDRFLKKFLLSRYNFFTQIAMSGD
jgi:hypothetical protein